MKTPTKKHLHVPLPELLYLSLRDEAKRSSRTATDLAREAIDRWLRERHRVALHAEIAAYAADCAGTTEDLDPDLERAAIEFLTGSKKGKRK